MKIQNMPVKFYYLVTGASSGIGYATALELSRDPETKVIAIARSGNKLERLREASGQTITTLVFDLENGDMRALAEQLIRQGIPSLNGIIHNAGFLVNRPFADITKTELEQSYRINVFGPYLLTQALMPLLEKSGDAHIVHISSVGGVQGSVKFPGLSAYSSSKGALSVLTECLATEFSERPVRVNCLALGAVQTEMLAQAFPGYKAPLQSHEMAGFIAWFLRNGHHFFNGKILPVALSTP